MKTSCYVQGNNQSVSLAVVYTCMFHVCFDIFLKEMLLATNSKPSYPEKSYSAMKAINF